MNVWSRTIAVAAIVGGAVAVAMPGVALAHARYKSSTPGTSEVVQASPAQVEITFTQHIQKVTGTYDITVEKDRGPSVTSGPAVIDSSDRSKMSVPLQPNLPPGRYVVNYKNVSDDDGDPFAGTFAFYVQTPPTTVDMANDAQLAQIGAPELTPGAGTTPGAATTPATTAAAPTIGAATAAPSVVPVQTALATAAPSTGTGGSGGSNTGRNIGIGVGVVIVLMLLAGGGWYAFGRGR